ncbi:DUF3347 domain-containing protein [Maribacter sp. 1_2014MBL_MicDiv]|uniref:DUF3347 domain-containing protein n=1 Tax=Maribacter sp. 1_2014MBL_MicDiv TaxID=1644130 RepID=UPI0008F53350|nr:DUF3347 domain-containing protein [Maribacter sp. 1_2014MBL_MicDiv]APA66049.1 hypothetical protein YQ22_18090 [Maribacter sp. 1_2014MBL_MicDiv]
MKTKKRSIVSVALLATIMLTVSCKDADKKATPSAKENVEKQEDMGKSGTMGSEQKASSEIILEDYFNLKNALVQDDNNKAQKLGGALAKSLGNLNRSAYTESQQVTLTDIIEDAIEHSEHISESDIAHQREHFKILSKDITDMIAITGSENTLYEQFCPMYDGGTAWLSKNEAVLNPYYGSSMLKCGKVQREIN